MTTSKLRWWAAGQLNRLPFTCWTSLCSWAMGGDWGALRTVIADSECRRHPSGCCYCGKFSPERRVKA